MAQLKKYNIGLDIGTNSVGWAVVEADTQKVMRKGNKPLWGVRLFSEAETVEKRRLDRSTRRRYDRRRERIKLLQEEFKEEINKVDKQFYKKLEESKYYKSDSKNKTIKISNDEINEIKNYYKKYPTIYHLRVELINKSEKKDIRLVYLAIHHIIKYRGNFLYNNSNFSIDSINITEKLEELFDLLEDSFLGNNELDFKREFVNFDNLEKILLLHSKNDCKNLLKKELEDITGKAFATEFSKLMVGNKANIKKMLLLDEEAEINFSSADYDEKYSECQKLLGKKIEILDLMKQLYDCIFLKKFFKDNKTTSISNLMVSYYEEHKKDLKFLKGIFNNNRTLYNKLFRSKDNKCLYDKYITNEIDYAEFVKSLDKLFDELFNNSELIDPRLKDQYTLVIRKKIVDGDFLPRINTTDNGKYPYQLNESELIKILENQGKFYSFLLDKSEDGITYKIVKLLEFKIPYYVGPLVSSKRSKNAWLIRNNCNEKITPYNFDRIVNKEATAEQFIRKMMSHCTYLLKEYALANNSILYSKFKVLNELKQIRINGMKIKNDIIHEILNDFFMKSDGVITDKKFKNYILSSGNFNMYDDDLNVTGYSAENKFANNMQSYVDFFGPNGIFVNTDYDEDDADQIIEWITIFEDKDILEKKVRNEFPKLEDSNIQEILHKKYTGWGRLSKKLLIGLCYNDEETGKANSIFDLMYETDENFMQILNNDKYGFQKKICEFNNLTETSNLDYSVVEELATSPATKRGIYQSLKIVQELVNYIGYDPNSIVIEMARNEGEKVRTASRKDFLTKLYETCKSSIENYNELKSELDSHEISSQKLFLYFIQEGKCLYSGKPLNIEDIENQSLYEVDHIVPRTLIKDDSIDNKALVLRECNQIKKDSYVLPKQYQNSQQIEWWNHLKKNKLMSPKKFYNLIRKDFSAEDIEGFINRQLVETRQITKHVANILKNYYEKSDIVYLKAELSHNYREKYNLFKFRDLNDYHHAHDAYLAAVLGDYKSKYINKKINYEAIKELNRQIINNDKIKNTDLKYGFVINSLDENISDLVFNIMKDDDKYTNVIKFNAHNFNKIIEDTLYRNDILVSRKTEIRDGRFYKEKIYKKGKGTIPVKSNMPVDIYGGYSNTNTKELVLVNYNDDQRKIIGIPMVLKAKNDYVEIDNFIKSQIKLNKGSNYTILKSEIPFETEIIYNNQNVYIKGYSIGHKNCELSNAVQLKISKNLMKKWKYAFQYLLNDKKVYCDEAIKNVDGIYEFLLNLDKYPLFANEVKKIKNNIDFKVLDVLDKKKIIKELIAMLHCNSVNANLSKFGLSDRIGRLSGNDITEGILISKSITGIRESRYEF